MKLTAASFSNVNNTSFKNSLMPQENKNSSKPKMLDAFQNKVKNSADMTDTLVVPRTIFKGYLGIMTGTSLLTLGSLMSSKFKKMSKAVTVAGVLTSFYGTWAFVRPYIIKDAPGVQTKKQFFN